MTGCVYFLSTFPRSFSDHMTVSSKGSFSRFWKGSLQYFMILSIFTFVVVSSSLLRHWARETKRANRIDDTIFRLLAFGSGLSGVLCLFILF